MAVIVIDANVFLSALIKDSTTREIILTTEHSFLFPEEMMSEIRKHQDLVLEKTGLSLKEYQKVLQIILQQIHLVPGESYLVFYPRAEIFMKRIDEKDIEYIACALGVDADFIWSDDEHFKRQTKVKVLNTREMVNFVLGL